MRVIISFKTACQWRMLPKDFPKWRSVHAYFQIWSERVDDQPSLLEQALKKLVERMRVDQDRTEKKAFALLMRKA